MVYKLGSRSVSRLRGVHPDLRKVVRRAIELTDVDFTVLEGMRSLARQKELYHKGASKTMNSRHLTGHAVDLGAWVGGAVRWDWPLYYKIADAMRQASVELGIAVEWGGAWGRLMSGYDDAQTASADYVSARRAKGRHAFIDGPHFQLSRRRYPA